MSQPDSSNAPSSKQLSSIDWLAKKNDWRLPRGIKSDRTMASDWLSVAFAIHSKADIFNPKTEADKDTKKRVQAACSALAEHYGVEVPAKFTRNDLSAWIAALGKHVATPDADKLLQYWQDALTYCDLNKLVEKGSDVAPGLKVDSLSQYLPPPHGLDTGAVEEQKRGQIHLSDSQRAIQMNCCPLSSGFGLSKSVCNCRFANRLV